MWKATRAALEEFDRWLPDSAPRCARTISPFSPPTTAAIPPPLPPTTAANTRRCSSSARECRPGVDLGLRATLSDIGQTVAENFGTSISERNQLSDGHLMRANPVMAGNWKMYKTPAETHAFFEAFKPLVAACRDCEIVICPPFPEPACRREGSPRQQHRHRRAESLLGQGRRRHRRSFRPHAAGRRLHATSSSRTANAASISARPKPMSSARRRPLSNTISRRSSASASGWKSANRTAPKQCSASSSMAASLL